MFTKRHTRQRPVVAGRTLAAPLVGALLLRTEFLDTTLQSVVCDEAIHIGKSPDRQPGDDRRVRRQDGGPILVGHLDQYFDGMVDVVNRYERTVNNYDGDNIMVLSCAPLEVKDPARKAVDCALEMRPWILARA